VLVDLYEVRARARARVRVRVRARARVRFRVRGHSPVCSKTSLRMSVCCPTLTVRCEYHPSPTDLHAHV